MYGVLSWNFCKGVIGTTIKGVDGPCSGVPHQTFLFWMTLFGEHFSQCSANHAMLSSTQSLSFQELLERS